jgi:polygalacturonase
VVADSPDEITLTTSDANLTSKGVNLPLIAHANNRNAINGVPTKAVDPSKVVDCSKAYVDFPAIGASNFFGSTWDSRH